MSVMPDLRRGPVGADSASQMAGLAALIDLPESLADADRIHAAPGGKSGIVVIVPARDEGVALADTLNSLARQFLRPDRVVVVVNNSTDSTRHVARTYASTPDSIPTDVLEMPGFNRHRKAGALNYGIRHLLRDRLLPPEIPFLLVMDGDTELDPHFLKRAQRILERGGAIGGVSAACLGKPIRGDSPWSDLLLLFQKVEYGRFAATRLRRNIHTMSGAGSFYRATALNDLLRQRPDVFEERESNLVEDYETTLALKMLGWRITSNQGCIAYTDLMPTMRMLLAQRIRWVRGTGSPWLSGLGLLLISVACRSKAGGLWPGSVPCRKVTVRDWQGTGRWQGRCGMRCWIPSTRSWSGRISSTGPVRTGRRRRC